MPYAQIAAAVAIALVLAGAADMLTGRRGFFAMVLVSGVGAVAGWFLAVRVFGVATSQQWLWLAWSGVAAAVSLCAFFLFRNKR